MKKKSSCDCDEGSQYDSISDTNHHYLYDHLIFSLLMLLLMILLLLLLLMMMMIMMMIVINDHDDYHGYDDDDYMYIAYIQYLYMVVEYHDNVVAR